MKVIIAGLLICITYFSFNRNNKFHGNTHSKNVKTVLAVDTVNHLKSPSITQLPFGFVPSVATFRTAQAYFINLLYAHHSQILNRWPKVPTPRHQIFKLPPIKSIEIISLNVSRIDVDTCQNGKPFSDYLKLTKYQYRLPDINEYKCYYYCNYPDNDFEKEFSEEAQSNCSAAFQQEFYGYLILYNPKLASAKVLTIYLDTEIDPDPFWRFFYIDKNFNIHIFENGQNAEVGDRPTSPFKKRIISISGITTGH
jgi:hypothetical protein